MFCYNSDCLQQNKEITKQLSDLTTKFGLIVKQNKELTSKVAVAQSTSKILQEAFQKTT